MEQSHMLSLLMFFYLKIKEILVTARKQFQVSLTPVKMYLCDISLTDGQQCNFVCSLLWLLLVLLLSKQGFRMRRFSEKGGNHIPEFVIVSNL